MDGAKLAETAAIVLPYRAKPTPSAPYSFSSLGLPVRPARPPRAQRNYATATHVPRNAMMSVHSPYGPSIPPPLLDKSNLYNFTAPPVPLSDLFSAFTLLGQPYYSHTEKPPAEPTLSEIHALLSPTPAQASAPASIVALASHPLLQNVSHAPPPSDLAAQSPESPSTALYSSSLIFHLGASGSAKRRYQPSVPTAPRPNTSPPPPPRPRSFTLPSAEAPSTSDLRSISVGEDAYFTRPDGMCIADGVGGWARSTRGPADAGRWSRLLTHFCERETEAWWAGEEGYTIPVDRSSEDDSFGLEGRQRRPLDPVEIMQRGYEKCLACMLNEVSVHDLSTCKPNDAGTPWFVHMPSGASASLATTHCESG